MSCMLITLCGVVGPLARHQTDKLGVYLRIDSVDITTLICLFPEVTR